MKKNRIILMIFFVLLISLFLITSAAPQLTGALQKTEIIEYGGLQVKDDVTCYLVRKETVYLAGSAGHVNYYIEEDQQVRKNVRILDVSPGGAAAESNFPALLKPSMDLGIPYGTPVQGYASEFIGAISYYLDGYETILSPESMLTVNRKIVEDAEFKTENVVRETGETAVAGDPLYKIIDDNIWYVLYWVPTEDVAKYTVGNAVTLNMPLGPVKGTINSVTDDGDAWRITLKFNRYYEEFAQIREVDAEAITFDNKGLIVGNESLAAEDGQVGLYVKDAKTGEFLFTPVKVLNTDGEHSLVAVSYFYDENQEQVWTVNAYDEILRRPK